MTYVATLLGNEHGDTLDLIQLSREGVSREALEKLQAEMSLSQKELATLIHLTPRTLQRMKGADKLPPAASGQLIEIAKVCSRAIEVLGDADRAKEWLRTPIHALNGARPVEMLDTPTGIQWVLDTLGRIEYGVYA